MTPSKPYLLRAIYQWIVDNKFSPYILIDTHAPRVIVPEHFVEEGEIVFNITPIAVHRLFLGNDAVEFDAAFSGVSYHLYIPVAAVKAIYAVENGKGMVFPESEQQDEMQEANTETSEHGHSEEVSSQPKKGRPQLRVVKSDDSTK